MIGFIGNIIGFLFFCLIVYLIIYSIKTHPEKFELEEGEEIIEIKKGDYWVPEFMWKESQNSGEIAFTNKRIMFKGMFINSSDKNISIPYSEIASIKKAFVMMFPVAFIVTTKDNQNYKFAIMKRDKYIKLINDLAQSN